MTSTMYFDSIDSKKIAEQVGETSSQSVVVAVDRYFCLLSQLIFISVFYYFNAQSIYRFYKAHG